MANRTCSLPDCEAAHYGKGYCQRHYAALVRRRKVASPDSLEQARRKVQRHSTLVGECWVWQARINANGYGTVNANIGNGDRSELAHRVSYVAFVGPIPKGHEIDHRCHNRACVNPDHLRACKRAKNMENRSGSYGASGIRGVYARPNGKWRAQAKRAGRIHSAGDYDDINDAAEAARLLRLRLFTHNDLDRTERP